MINSLVPVLLAGAILACTQSCTAEQYVLVKNGVSKCAIILPADYTPPMEYGAKDLSKHLNLMSGADVAIYKQKNDSDIPSGYEGLIILTNKPAMDQPAVGGEELYITTKPGKPWIISIYGDKKRGAMYGCYALLQDVLGCRWFTQTISKIPKKKTIAVGNLKIHQKPSFELRDPYFYEALGNTEWIVRNRVNGSQCNVDDSAGGKVIFGTMIAHTMFGLIPPEKYFDTHPEYYALVKGKRVSNTQLCLTNPDTLRICTESIMQLIKQTPSANIFSVSQMDNEEGACTCENCQKVLNEEGAQSGPILRFVNAIAAEVAKKYPDVLIETLAYNYSQKPPKVTKPLPNVRIRLCTPWTCKAHSLDSGCSQNSINTYTDLLAWSKITNQLYIWDYNTEFNDFMLIHPAINYTKTVNTIFKKTGVVGVFMLGSYNSPGGCLSELKSYLCSRLMWDHTQNPDKILNEYIDSVYGKSAPIMKEWLSLIHSPFKNQKTVISTGIYDLPSAPYLTKDILDKSDDLMEKAMAVSAGDPVALEEVKKARMWVDYTRIAQIKLSRNVEGDKFNYGVSNKDLDRIDRWLESIKHYNVTRLSEGAYDVSDLLTYKNAKVDCLTLDNDKLRLDVLPALGGKVVRLLDKKNGVDLMLPPKSVFHKGEGGYEGYAAEPIRGTEFWDVKYDSKIENNTMTLKGISPAGREITKQFVLNGNKLLFTTSVKNTTNQPLPVKICERPQFPLQSFGDVKISFDKVGGGVNIIDGKADFSINWIDQSREYKGNDLPTGSVVMNLKNTTLTSRFNPQNLDMFLVFHNGGLPTEMISMELYCKPVTLQPGESTSFEQEWTIE